MIDFMKIDYIGRYIKGEDGKFYFIIGDRAKTDPTLYKLAEIVRDSKSQFDLIYQAENLGHINVYPFGLGKIGDVFWDIPNDNCVVKLTNKNVCAIIPIGDIKRRRDAHNTV